MTENEKETHKLKISTVSVSIEDLEKAQILSEHAEKTPKQMFHDYINQLWELAGTYKTFNLSYCLYRNQLIIEVSGKNRVSLGIPEGLSREDVEHSFGYKRGEHGELIDTTEKPSEAKARPQPNPENKGEQE